jgi:site-specific recombinase XerD
LGGNLQGGGIDYHDVHFHDLRHELASRLAESPVAAIHDVAAVLGDANINTPLRYLGTTGRRIQNVMEPFRSTAGRGPPAGTSVATWSANGPPSGRSVTARS